MLQKSCFWLPDLLCYWTNMAITCCTGRRKLAIHIWSFVASDRHSRFVLLTLKKKLLVLAWLLFALLERHSHHSYHTKGLWTLLSWRRLVFPFNRGLLTQSAFALSGKHSHCLCTAIMWQASIANEPSTQQNAWRMLTWLSFVLLDRLSRCLYFSPGQLLYCLLCTTMWFWCRLPDGLLCC